MTIQFVAKYKKAGNETESNLDVVFKKCSGVKLSHHHNLR